MSNPDTEVQIFSPGSMTVDPTEVSCSICSLPIENYVPDYFMGEKFNPCCQQCNLIADEDYGQDPFASFPDFGLPPSLVSHWIPPTGYSPCSLGLISSSSHTMLSCLIQETHLCPWLMSYQNFENLGES